MLNDPRVASRFPLGVDKKNMIMSLDPVFDKDRNHQPAWNKDGTDDGPDVDWAFDRDGTFADSHSSVTLFSHFSFFSCFGIVFLTSDPLMVKSHVRSVVVKKI